MRGIERIGWERVGGKHRFDEAGRRGKDRREVGHHVNCIPDCGLLKSGALHRAVPPALARVPRPQTGSNKPATTGQVRLATGSPPLGTAGGYTRHRTVLCMYVCLDCTNPYGENLCVHPPSTHSLVLTSPLMSIRKPPRCAQETSRFSPRRDSIKDI